MNKWLLVAAGLSIIASVLHVACIIGGGDWYRFFGAGEEMAQLAEAGSPRPAILTAIVAAILAGWALYALSGARIIRRLPFLRSALVAITVVLLLRAALAFVPAAWAPEQTLPFIVWSSLIVAAMGVVFAIGTVKAWRQLARRVA